MNSASMDAAHVPAGSIVVGIDGSTHADTALAWATEQAQLEQRPLTIVHSVRFEGFPGAGGMYPGTGFDYGLLIDETRTAGHALLSDAAAKVLATYPDLTVHRVLGHSDPRSILLDLGGNAAMIVLGSRGRGPVASLLLGSVSVSVSKHAACPVVVLRPAEATARSGILVGVDGTERSQPALEFAYRMASWRALPLTVLHSYWEEVPAAHTASTTGTWTNTGTTGSEQALVAESLAGMQEKFPEVSVQVRLTLGFAAGQLIGASRGYDLMVIGHQPDSVLDDILHDSVAPTVVEHAECPVAVVPSPVSVAGATSR